MRIGIIVAMAKELELLLPLLQDSEESRMGGFVFYRGNMGKHDVMVMQCGIGKVNAAMGALTLVNAFLPDYIINSGVAGGADKSVSVMDVVAGERVAYHDVWCGMGNAYGQVQGMPERFDAHPVLLQCVEGIADRETMQVKQGLICTGDQFITDREALSRIKNRFPDGLACEMESAAIAQSCHIYGIPFMSIRVISDTPGNTDNHQQQWDEFLASMGERSFLFMQQYLGCLPSHF